MSSENNDRRSKMRTGGASSGGYGLAFIGTLIYYMQHATSFGDGVIGFFKAILWPAFLVYHLLEYLKM